MSVGCLLLVAAASMVSGALFGHAKPRFWLAATLTGALAGFLAAAGILASGGVWEWRDGFVVGGEPLHLRMDGISALFLVLLFVVGGAGAIYSSEYWKHARHPRSAPFGRVWWSIMLLSLSWLLLTANGLHFLIAWEAFTLSGYFLITLERWRFEVRVAGWLYLGCSHAACQIGR